MADIFDQYQTDTPSLKTADEFTIIDGKKVKVVRPSEMKDEPEVAIHHHNNLDQPSIDLGSEIVGSIAHSDLTGVTSDQHHAQTHAASHTSGGADDLTGQTLAAIILSGGRMTGGTVNTSSIGTPTITGGAATNLILVTPTVGTPTVTGGTATGFDNINTYSGTITRGTTGLMGTIAITGHRTLVITRGTTDLISSITDSVRTWTYIRDSDDYIISWAVT